MTEDSWILIFSHEDLSLAEIVSYLEAREMAITVLARSENVVVFSSQGIEPSMVNDLGGTLKIGKVCLSLREKDASSYEKLKVELDSSFTYPHLEDKAHWGISVYGAIGPRAESFRDIVEEYFKERLRRDGVRKAKVVRPKHEGLTSAELLSYDVAKLDMIGSGLEVLAGFADGYYYLSRSSGLIDNLGFYRRDFERPVQKSEISIPPKLARILVNLVGAKRGKVLLDPFCGIGTIIQEALAMGADAIGSDIDPWCVSACKKNLDWFSRVKDLRNVDWRVIRCDARNITEHLRRDGADCIATEPILLPPLSETPSRERALEMADESGKVYFEAMREMVKVLRRKGRIAIVQPYILTRDESIVSFPMAEMAKAVGLRPHYPSLTKIRWRYPLMITGRKGQTVVRAVHVLEKP